MNTTRRDALRTVGVVFGAGVLGSTAVRGSDIEEPADETWTRTYELDGDERNTTYVDAAARRDDAAVDERDALGTTVLAGRSMDDGDLMTYWALEVDPDGELLATTSFERDEDGTVTAVVPTPDGCVVVGTDFGPADAITAPWTPWATKIDPDGIRWRYGKNRAVVEETHVVSGATGTSDGGFVVGCTLGDYDTEARVIRLAADGSVVWERSIERERPSALEAVVESNDGHLLVGGSIGEVNDRSAWLVALDGSGDGDGGGDGDANDLWERTYDEADGIDVTSVRHLAIDGDTVVLGLSGVTDAVGPVVAAADPDGSLRWSEYLFSSNLTTVEAIAPVETGYVVGGHYVTIDSEYDYWLGSVSRDGDVRWLSQYVDGGYFGDLSGHDPYAVFAGNDGQDATARRFDPTRAPWQDENAFPVDTVEEGGHNDEQTADDQTNDEQTVTEESAHAGSGDDGLPGFGVAEAVAGFSALELGRRYREE